jgi:multicomponent Na+:H+ antiporter subunit G
VNAALTYSLLGAGAALQLLAVAGLLLARDPFERLHLSAPATLGALLIAIAVLVHESFSVIGLKAILVAAFLVFSAPLVTHAIARAVRRERRGDWRIGADEAIEVEPR